MITPPVAIASFAAAAVANSDPMRTAWASVKLGAMAYVVPFIFIFSQELLLRGSPALIAWAIITTALGAVFLGAGMTGYLYRPLPAYERVLFIACAIALFFNHSFMDNFGFWLNGGAAVAGAALVAMDRSLARKAGGEVSTAKITPSPEP